MSDLESPPNAAKRRSRLSTPVALFLALLIALLPIGGLLVASAVDEMNKGDDVRRSEAGGELLSAAGAAESLIARNTLALRVAANGALQNDTDRPCQTAREALEIAPALARDFSIVDFDGKTLCGNTYSDAIDIDPVPPGGVTMWIDEAEESVLIRVGVARGTATSKLTREEIAAAVRNVTPDIANMTLSDGERQLVVFDRSVPEDGAEQQQLNVDIAAGRIEATESISVLKPGWDDRMLVVLPILMWLVAALIAWVIVERLLTRPLRHLRRTVVEYDPDGGDFELPDKLGPASEINDLGAAFVDTFGRIEESEDRLVAALDGQRRLVREVHHRVKNNLQVVASLLNIHSRTAVGAEAQSAYAGIGRRVEALAVVHRNHFAEVEESRGIQLRPLVTELASSLRASAPDGRAAPIQLDLDSASTTQDTAVAAAFLITEIVEYAMDHEPDAGIEITLRRSSELTARLSVASSALVEGADTSGEERVQFDRVVDGLSRQLRSALERKVGSYAVELPIFPEN